MSFTGGKNVFTKAIYKLRFPHRFPYTYGIFRFWQICLQEFFCCLSKPNSLFQLFVSRIRIKINEQKKKKYRMYQNPFLLKCLLNMIATGRNMTPRDRQKSQVSDDLILKCSLPVSSGIRENSFKTIAHKKHMKNCRSIL